MFSDDSLHKKAKINRWFANPFGGQIIDANNQAF